MIKGRGLLPARLALAVAMSVPAAEALATDVSNYSFNPYAYRTVAPAAPVVSPPAPYAPRLASPSLAPARPSAPHTAALPLPNNEACVGLCRLLELMWRLERPEAPGSVPTS